MKKTLITIFVMMMLCFSVNNVLADSFNVVVDSKTANPGDTVEINISLENNSGIIAALFSVEYDKERLELVEVQDGKILDSGTFSPSYNSYPYKMVWNSASASNFTSNGVLAKLKFKVLENAKAGKAFINLSYNENDVFDVDLKNVPVTLVNGGIDVVNNAQGGGSGSGGGGGSSTPKPSGKEDSIDTPDNVAGVITPSLNDFSEELSGHWGSQEISALIEKGIVKGNNGKLNLKNSVTRAELLALITRAMGIGEKEYSGEFADVNASDWYAGTISAARAAGLVDGDGRNVMPNQYVTREQMAKFLVTAYIYKNGEVPEGEAIAFDDSYAISEWATEFINKATSLGILNGMGDGTFAPKNAVLREQAFVAIARLIK